MITMDELRRVARIKGIKNMGYAEKDYFQEILLLGISREVPDLVFKGGTALYKFHGLGRFSEDLDFNGLIEEKTIKRLKSYLEDYGYPTLVDVNESKFGLLLTFKTQGLLFQGTSASLSRVRMDISFKEPVMEASWSQLFPLYQDLPTFRLKTMNITELLSEKFRAMLVRRFARDAYDVWFLLNKKVELDKVLIQTKLDLYDLVLEKTLLESTFDEIKPIWDMELRSLMLGPPDFELVKVTIENALK